MIVVDRPQLVESQTRQRQMVKCCINMDVINIDCRRGTVRMQTGVGKSTGRMRKWSGGQEEVVSCRHGLGKRV